MNSAEIRETYLSFFEQREHMRLASASLVPSSHDPTVLLNVAGMQPLKPYFMGLEAPPAPRLTSSQRCFRTKDIEEVGKTKRHLTFFEMLGNFSVGDYFKEEAIGFGWELSTGAFGFDPELIWVTVFEGDEELGLGPDTEAIELWKAIGVPEERIVGLPRSENFWQGGPTGPCGPCSEMYIDRGEAYGGPGDRPGDESERFLEYWNLVFMAYELRKDGSLPELPAQNIDTGMGLERMAVIQQGVDSVFDTDLFKPLIELAEEISGRRYGADGSEADTRAMRIIADHSRGAVELIADGVVPSNEERGYVLRRLMRRAIQQGRSLGLEAPYLDRFAERVIEILGEIHPQLGSERETIRGWVKSEEESFARTLERGSVLLERLIDRAKAEGADSIAAADAFELHDTFGFPYDLTRELLADNDLSVDDEGFQSLMGAQRSRARKGGGGGAMADRHDAIIDFVGSSAESRFVGYSRLAVETAVAAATPIEGSTEESLAKLEESPFYPEGGGQVSDSGSLRIDGEEVAVLAVHRVGSDQALRIAAPVLEPGASVAAAVARAPRIATMANHTATHLLHAALRQRLGPHVHQAGSAVRPDKLRFDFSHGSRLSEEELLGVEDQVNEWIKASSPVLAMEMERAEAERLGAMALFGEKYGDWVRMVEVPEVSRELCGGTHVANTAEIGIFTITSEGSSASNVRRVEALTGPAAIDFFRERSAVLDAAGRLLGGSGDPLAAAQRVSERLEQLEREAAGKGAEQVGERGEEIAQAAEERAGIKLAVGSIGELADQKKLLEVADRTRARLGASAVVLGGAADGKVALVGAFSAEAIAKGLSAAAIVRSAAEIVGGGGGGRDDIAQAGGRDPEKLDEALDAALKALREGLGS